MRWCNSIRLSFPRRRESSPKNISAEDSASRWIPACAGMTSITILALLLVTLIAYQPAIAAEEKPEEKLSTTLKSLELSKEEATEIKDKLERNHQESLRLQQRATELAEALQASETRVTREEVRYGSVAAQLADKQKEFDVRAADYAKSVRSMLTMQNIPTTAMVAAPEHIPELLQTTSVLRNVNAALRQRATALKTEMAALNTLKEKAANSKATLTREQAMLEQRQQSLATELTARQKLQQALSKDHAEALAKVTDLSRESQNLQELIGKLERNRNRVAIATKAAPRALPTSAAKGNWRIPVAGTIAHRFGDRRNANESWRGMVLRARTGGSVVAPSAGEVVFTGPFRDYGRMVLIKHKNKHISLLAGMGTISVALNQQVARGEPLGTMGNSAPVELYVELREDSKPIDPAGWYATTTSTASAD
jgi:septal ring factor EnvC (AmiA/AmiB activator)